MSIGSAVKLVTRICAHHERGQTAASDVVRELAEGRQFLFGDLRRGEDKAES